MYKITLRMKRKLQKGNCASCDFHGLGGGNTFCGLTGECVPEGLDTEKRRNKKCPVVKVERVLSETLE